MIEINGSVLTQWDVGRSVKITGIEVECVHFANKGDSKAVIIAVVDSNAIIPNYLLQTGKDLCVYAVKDGVTVESNTFYVKKRERPENYVYDDDQRNYIYELITNAEQIIRDASNAANEAENAVESANQAADRANDAAAKVEEYIAAGGIDGFSPIAKVTQTAEGATIEITDKNGTTAATVTNGKDYVLTEADKEEIAGMVPGGEVPPTDELVQAVINALPVYDGSYTDDKENGGSYYTKEEAEDRFCDEGEVKALIDEAMSYVPIDITAIENNVGTVEMGSTVEAVTISWAINKESVSQTVNGEGVDASARSTVVTGTFTKDTTFTLNVTDEKGATDSASTKITFLNGVYYGVIENGAELNSATILSLTRKLQSSKGLTFTVDAGKNERIIYALPTRYGTPTFTVGGFAGGFSKVGAVDFTNASGYTESYDVWVSDNVGLGSTTVKVS